MSKNPEEGQNAATRDLAETSIFKNIREFLKDPAGAVEARAANPIGQTGQAELAGQTGPGVTQKPAGQAANGPDMAARNAAGQPPAGVPPFSTADRLAEQERMGKGLPGFKARVLTVAEADGLFAPLGDTELSAGEKLGRLTAGLGKYGEHADRALDELGLPDRATAAVRQAMENPGRPYVAALAGELLWASLSFEPDAERRAEMIEKKLAESRAAFPVREASARANAGMVSDAGGGAGAATSGVGTAGAETQAMTDAQDGAQVSAQAVTNAQEEAHANVQAGANASDAEPEKRKALMTNDGYRQALDEAAKGQKIESDTDIKLKAPRFFILYPLFEQLAEELDTDVDFLLAHAALESGWLDTHNTELHNLFGVTRAGGKNLEYPSFEAAIQHWVKLFGDRVRGARTMDEYINGLRFKGHAAYNSARSDYDELLRKMYPSIVKRKVQCLPDQ